MKRALGIFLFFPSIALAETPAVSFVPDEARPYFDASHAGDAIRRFHAEDWAGAAKAFEEYRRPAAATAATAMIPAAIGARATSAMAEAVAHAQQARFLEAISLSKAGQYDEAARAFDELATSYPLLADYHRLYAARALLAAKHVEKALERARLVDRSSVLDAEARYVRGDALERLALLPESEREFRGYVEAYPSSWRESDVLLRLAQVIEARSKTMPPKQSRLAEARDLYRQITIRFPTQNAARTAEARLHALAPAALTLSGPEHLVRGLALFEQMRNAESEAAFRSALAAGDLDAARSCVASYHLAQSVFKARDRPRAAPLFDAAAAACERASGHRAQGPASTDAQAADLDAKALYQAGRCHAAKDEVAEALAAFSKVEAEHPAHSYADDSRLRRAEIVHGTLEALRAGKSAPTDAQRARITLLVGAPCPSEAAAAIAALEAHEQALLASIADAYPSGDQGGEALFRLAFHAFELGALPEARRWLDKELVKFPREDGWWEAGRTLYWLGRIDDRQGKRKDAAERYARAARDYPLSYYALAAINRLREAAPDDARALVEALAAPAATPGDLAWRFEPSPIFSSPSFLRGVELARLSLGTEARRELSAAGIKVPDKRGAKVEGAGAEQLLWLAAVLYDGAGEWALSHFIPRHVLPAFAARWPVADNRKRWLLSFPEGYADLIIDNARKNGQPPALEFAIVREESAFDPLDESFANAVGLTQLTQAPAKRFAQGLPYSREALKDPVINVTIGARELGDLWKRTGGSAALSIAGYNAGDGAVRRWLRASPTGQSLDEFIERIPYDETRGYTKRVLGSWFAYHWLYEHTGDPVPVLAQALPTGF